MFLTGPEFLPELREHRGRTLTLIQDAQATGRTRMAEMNTHVLTNLDRRRGVRARDRTDRERLGQSPYITGAPWPPRAGTRRSLVRSRTSSSYAASFLRGGRVGAATFLGAKRQRGRLELSQLHRAGPRHEFVELLLGEEVGSAKAAGSAPRSNSPDFRTTRASTRNTRASGSWWPLLRGCGPRIATVTLHVAMGVGGEGCFRGRLGMTTAVVYSCCAAVRTGSEATSDFSWSFSRVTHLSVRTLRRYHDAGLLEPATVDPASGYRYYTADQIPTAQVIHRLRELDVPLPDVQRILRSPDPGARAALVSEHLQRLESELDRTRAAVTSLRRLLRPEPAPLGVELRAVPATTVAAVEDDVEHGHVIDWYAGAMAELDAVVREPTGVFGRAVRQRAVRSRPRARARVSADDPPSARRPGAPGHPADGRAGRHHPRRRARRHRRHLRRTGRLGGEERARGGGAGPGGLPGWAPRHSRPGRVEHRNRLARLPGGPALSQQGQRWDGFPAAGGPAPPGSRAFKLIEAAQDHWRGQRPPPRRPRPSRPDLCHRCRTTQRDTPARGRLKDLHPQVLTIAPGGVTDGDQPCLTIVSK